MIRYKKHQITGEKNPLKGLWYAHPVIEETFDIEKLAKHMSNHNTPHSADVTKGVLAIFKIQTIACSIFPNIASAHYLLCNVAFIFPHLYIHVSNTLSQRQAYFRETDANDTFLFHSRIYHSTKSIANRVPFSKSRFTFLPKISFRYLGCNPKPGRTERTFCSVMTSPAFMSFDT